MIMNVQNNIEIVQYIQGERSLMTNVGISEFRKNIKHFSKVVEKEDLMIFSNGKPIMKITSPYKNRIAQIKSLKGIAKTKESFEEIMAYKLKEL